MINERDFHRELVKIINEQMVLISTGYLNDYWIMLKLKRGNRRLHGKSA